MTTLRVNVTADSLISSNVHYFWADKANRVRTLRGLGWAITRGQARDAHHDRCRLTVTVTYPPRARIRDASNLHPTAKALLDGCVDGGLLDDDNDTIVIATTYQASSDKGTTGVWRFQLDFDEVTA